ncbi:MAG: DUF2199 domain-containing protein [Parvibaculum sp.]|nr:DUF2199 domain-containing protein [Parvibaculum sp.]
MDYTWTCRCCGKRYETLPLDFATDAPASWLALSERDREERTRISADVCIVDDKDIFIRGCLEIPILDHPEKFTWGLWVSVSEQSYERIVELWGGSVPDNEPPKFGWLCNSVGIYPPAVGLKTNLHLRSDGLRPLIELEPTNHPLALDQRDGISMERVKEIVAELLHRP